MNFIPVFLKGTNYIEKLKSGEVDALIMGKLKIEEWMEYHELSSSQLAIISKTNRFSIRKNKVTFEDLRNEGIILRERSYNEEEYDSIMAEFHDHGFMPKIIKTTKNSEDFFTEIQMGDNPGIIGSGLLLKYYTAGLFINIISDSSYNYGVVVAWNKNERNLSAINLYKSISL